MTRIEKNQALLILSKINEEIKEEIIVGPQIFMPSVYTFLNKLLEIKTILEDEYASIIYIDGNIKNIKGPETIINNTQIIKNIEVKKILFIESNELIVTHTINQQTFQTTRNIIKGPKYFIPLPTEKILNFIWSGTSKNSKYNIKQTNQLQFNVFKNISQQMYLDVLNVFTSDHVDLTIKLMIFYDFINIEKMLDNTNDPICNISTEIINLIIKNISNMTFDEFKNEFKNINTKINDNEYENLDRIGVKINKISLIGYEAPTILQEIHNNSLKEKMKIILDKEIIEGEELNKSYKLNEQLKRNLAEIKLNTENIEASLINEKQKHIFEKYVMESKLNLELHKLNEFKKLGIDIVEYLTKPDNKIEFTSKNKIKYLTKTEDIHEKYSKQNDNIMPVVVLNKNI